RHTRFHVTGVQTCALPILIDAARAEGLDVAFDIYPYLAGNAPLSQLLPAWAQEGGDEAMRARLTERAVRTRIRDEWRDLPNSWEIGRASCRGRGKGRVVGG